MKTLTIAVILTSFLAGHLSAEHICDGFNFGFAQLPLSPHEDLNHLECMFVSSYPSDTHTSAQIHLLVHFFETDCTYVGSGTGPSPPGIYIAKDKTQ